MRSKMKAISLRTAMMKVTRVRARTRETRRKNRRKKRRPHLPRARNADASRRRRR